MPTGDGAYPILGAAYWIVPGMLHTPGKPPAASERGTGESYVWVEEVSAQIPCHLTATVTLERLQPQPVTLLGWELSPIRATARIPSDRQTVEVTFFGSCSVFFADPDGEHHQAKRSFQWRRELLVPSLPPHAAVRVLAGGSRGEGTLQRGLRGPSFRGQVHLVGLVHVTEPTLRRADYSGKVTAPIPVPVRLAPGARSPAGPLQAGSGNGSGGMEPSLSVPLGDWAAQWTNRRAGLEAEGTVLQGVLHLAPGLRPIALHTAPADPENTEGSALQGELAAEDDQGRLHTARWVIEPPPGKQQDGGALGSGIPGPGSLGSAFRVLREEWTPMGTRSSSGVQGPAASVSHTLWVREVPAAGPGGERVTIGKLSGEQTSSADAPPRPRPVPLEPAARAGEGEPESGSSPGAAPEQAERGTGERNVIVWRLPQPTAPEGPAAPIHTSRPGSSSGSR